MIFWELNECIFLKYNVSLISPKLSRVRSHHYYEKKKVKVD